MAASRAYAPARPTVLLGAAGLAANAAIVTLSTRSPALLAVAVLVVAVAVLAFVRPGVLLLTAAFGLVVSGDLLDLVFTFPNLAFAGFQIQLSDLFLVAILLAWAGWELRRGGVGPPLAELAREPAFAGFVPLFVLATYDLARAGHGVFSSARIFGFCVLVPVVVRVVETPRQLRLLGVAIAAAAAISSVAALAMVAAGRSVTDRGLSTGGARGLSIGGSFLVAGALLYVLAALVADTRPLSGLAPALVLLLLGGVAASGARETWIGVLAALAVFALLSSLRGAMRLGLVVVLAGLLAFGAYSIVPHPPKLEAQLASVEQRLSSVNPSTAASDPSVQVRYDKWNVVWGQLKAHPLLGTGFGYPATYTSNIGGSNFVRSYVDDPENTHLWLWARMGTLGFLAWVGFNVLALGTLVVRLLRTRVPAARTAALWAAGVLIVIWSGMAFSPVSAFGSTLLLYWLAIALVPVTGRLAAGPR
ncbi:MAG TPA: O-antigen ligase family protein [Gaiellaceae bacterium]|nr:O-antigen ligase family protein [Gaiellaceae bacterium]